MMDGGPITDPHLYRALRINRLCAEFHCLPSAAEDELENDPDQLCELILDIRGYMPAKQAFDQARDKVSGTKGWDGNPYMSQVQVNTYEAKLAACGLSGEDDGR